MLEYGDYVECKHCGFKGLVETGEEVCPQCHQEGELNWVFADPDKQVCTREFVGGDLLQDLLSIVGSNAKIKYPFLHFPKGSKAFEVQKLIERMYGIETPKGLSEVFAGLVPPPKEVL